MDLQNMSIDQKISMLQELVNKASFDINYATQCRFGNDKETKLIELMNIVKNSVILKSRFENMEYVERQVAIDNCIRNLDTALLVFPEFYQVEETVAPRMR